MEYLNVSLWIHRDHGIYCMAHELHKNGRSLQEAAQILKDYFDHIDNITTPDGAAFTIENIMAALRGIWGEE